MTPGARDSYDAGESSARAVVRPVEPPRACTQRYAAMVKTCAVDTHRSALAEAKAFGA